jgi:hypothetical protein
MGFAELKSVSYVFINWFGIGVFVLVLDYVDDFLMLSLVYNGRRFTKQSLLYTIPAELERPTFASE